MKQPNSDFPASSSSEGFSLTASEGAWSPSALLSWRFWLSACGVFLSIFLPLQQWQGLWRGGLLATGLIAATAYGSAEQQHSSGYSAPGEFATKRAMLLESARLFPFETRFAKGAAYLDFFVSTAIEPTLALADLRLALASDPYAPDLLNAQLFFALRAGQRELAQHSLALLLQTEPGFTPSFLKRVDAP